jgi:dihydrodipicolinate synthase/N-acetylneuraminate lyase
MVYNSRLSLMTEKEVKKINLFCIKIVKKLDKKNLIICAEPYHSSTIQSINHVNYLKKNGADLVSLIFGEKYYSDNQIYDHFKKIHDKTNCSLLLHQQILENGISSNPNFVYYSMNVLKKISKLPRFVAMKEDAKNDNYTKQICKEISKNMTIITSGGGKRQWLRSAKYGCTSWLSGVSNLNPKIALDFYKYYKGRKTKQINFILKYIEDPFFKIKSKFGWHLTIKAFLELNKIFKRYERSPLKELDRHKLLICKKVFETIKKKIKDKKIENYFNY